VVSGWGVNQQQVPYLQKQHKTGKLEYYRNPKSSDGKTESHLEGPGMENIDRLAQDLICLKECAERRHITGVKLKGWRKIGNNREGGVVHL